MKVSALMESVNSYARSQKRIARDAKKFRCQIDRDKDKKRKDDERNHKKQDRLSKKLTKSNINSLLTQMKTSSKTKGSLLSLINDLDENQVKSETLKFARNIAEQIDKLKTKKNQGTVLVTRNFNLVPKIINNPLVSDNKDPKVIKAVSKLVRTSNIDLHPKFNPRNRTDNYRMLNNILFNAIRDLVLELIRSDMTKIQGVEDGN